MVASLRETVLKSRGLEEKKTVALPIDQISPSPYQPRIYFNQAELIELAESIRQVGLLQPVEVRRSGTTGYELVFGERRLRAFKLLRDGYDFDAPVRDSDDPDKPGDLFVGENGAAGDYVRVTRSVEPDPIYSVIPAVIVELDDEQLERAALDENTKRADLSPLEDGFMYQAIIKRRGITHSELARRYGISRPHVTNRLRLVDLPQPIHQLFFERTLGISAGLTLLDWQNKFGLPKEYVEFFARLLAAKTISTGFFDTTAPGDFINKLLTIPGVREFYNDYPLLVQKDIFTAEAEALQRLEDEKEESADDEEEQIESESEQPADYEPIQPSRPTPIAQPYEDEDDADQDEEPEMEPLRLRPAASTSSATTVAAPAPVAATVSQSQPVQQTVPAVVFQPEPVQQQSIVAAPSATAQLTSVSTQQTTVLAITDAARAKAQKFDDVYGAQYLSRLVSDDNAPAMDAPTARFVARQLVTHFFATLPDTRRDMLVQEAKEWLRLYDFAGATEATDVGFLPLMWIDNLFEEAPNKPYRAATVAANLVVHLSILATSVTNLTPGYLKEVGSYAKEVMSR